MVHIKVLPGSSVTGHSSTVRSTATGKIWDFHPIIYTVAAIPIRESKCHAVVGKEQSHAILES